MDQNPSATLYEEETSVMSILRRRSGEQIAAKSLGLFPITWRIRRWMIRLVDHPYFEFAMTIVIIANAIIMALYDPINATNPNNYVIDSTEIFFVSVYTAEMLVKIFAFGFYWENQSSTYFRDRWSLIDLTVVVLGWIGVGTDEIFGAAGSFASALRLLRILRPMRLSKASPATSWVTRALIRSVPQLISGGVLFLLLFTIAGIIGMVFFRGVLRQRCVYISDPTKVLEEDLENNRFCSFDYQPYGRHCAQANTTCALVGQNPNFNITSFDNILWTVIILFQIITMEGWSDIMYMVSDTNGVASQIFFVVGVMLGGIFILNVLVAVLAVNITVQRELDQTKTEEDEDVKAIERKLLERKLLAEKFGAEDLTKQRAYVRFLKRHRISLKDSMDMRLMLSYERMKSIPGYTLVSEKEYARLNFLHRNLYPEWKKHVTPILDPSERLAAAKRDQQLRDERREWERRAAQLTSGKEDKTSTTTAPLPALDRSRFTLVTPPFINVEVEMMEAEAQIRLGEYERAKRNRFQKLDSYVDRKWANLFVKFKEVKAEGFAGEKDNAYRIRKWCFWLVTQKWFDLYLMNTLILVNVFMLSAVHFNQPEWVFEMEFVADVFFAVIFIVEMLLKMCAFGFLKYLVDPWLRFDGMIAIVSVFQFVSAGTAYVAAFRALRILRLLRFLFSLKSMRRILLALNKTLKTILPFLFILFLFLFIATIVGLQLFGGAMEAFPEEYDCSPSYVNFPHCPPRQHFDSFFPALVTSFQILTKDDWYQVMFRVVSSTSYWAFIYFFFVVVVGTLVVLNIFLGVLIDSFLHASEERRKLEFETEQKTAAVSNYSLRDGSRGLLRPQLEPENNPVEAGHALKEHVKEQRKVIEKRKLWRFVNHPSYPHRPWGFLIVHDSTLRIIAGNIVSSPIFQYFVIITIIISSVAICFESANVTPELRFYLECINIFVASVFFLEFVLKLFSLGAVGHPGAYFTDPFNCLDFGLVLTLILSLIVQTLGWIRLVHAFRAFYPLRIIRHVEGLRVALITVTRAVLPVTEVALFVCFFVIAAAIFGTLIFQGSFYSCYDGPSTAFSRRPQDDICFPTSSRYSSADCPLTRQCNASDWLNPTLVQGGGASVSFDNLPSSLLLLFELSALEDWYKPMFAAMDRTTIGHNFARENAPYSALYFMFFVLVFNVLLVQLFVAIVVDSFRQSERDAQARTFLTPRQFEWIRMQKRAFDLPYRSKELPPILEPFRTIHGIVVSKAFKVFMLSVTVFNAGVLLSLHTDAAPEYVLFLDIVDYLVGSLYLVEAFMKIAAFGAGQYFRRSYNWLDFSVCVTTIIGWAIPDAKNVVQLFDAFRILEVVYYFPTTRHLVATLYLSTPALVNVSGLVFLVFYIYAIIGVAVFSGIRDFPPATGDFAMLDDYTNFDNFGSSLLTLFRMSTGENWNSIMRDMVTSSNVHVANFAYVYCLTFIVVIQFCLINLIVAVIMFDIQEEIANTAKGKSSNVSIASLARYSKVWADVRYEYENKMRDRGLPSASTTDHGPQNTSRIEKLRQFVRDLYHTITLTTDSSHPQMRMPCTQLANLIVHLPPPLGLYGVRNVTRADTLRVINALKIPVNANGEIHYHATLSALIDAVVLGDVINKTLKESVIGIKSPDPLSIFKSNSTAVAPEFLFDRVTEDLRDLLNLKIPTAAIKYKNSIQTEVERADGYDAAQVIATRLLYKAADRYLRRKEGGKLFKQASVRMLTGDGQKATSEGNPGDNVSEAEKKKGMFATMLSLPKKILSASGLGAAGAAEASSSAISPIDETSHPEDILVVQVSEDVNQVFVPTVVASPKREAQKKEESTSPSELPSVSPADSNEASREPQETLVVVNPSDEQ